MFTVSDKGEPIFMKHFKRTFLPVDVVRLCVCLQGNCESVFLCKLHCDIYVEQPLSPHLRRSDCFHLRSLMVLKMQDKESNMRERQTE